MYKTIEADIHNGHITSAELAALPDRAHVLITLLDRPGNNIPDWSVIEGQIGKLRLRLNTEEWQRSQRGEWS